MFEPEWMEYFEREAPFSYYCILFLQFLITILSYFSYVVLLIVIAVPIFMIYSGTKAIKIKLIEDKKHKKLRKEKENHEQLHENLYLDRLDRNIKKKKKHK
jgi:predicted membrane protein